MREVSESLSAHLAAGDGRGRLNLRSEFSLLLLVSLRVYEHVMEYGGVHSAIPEEPFCQSNFTPQTKPTPLPSLRGES